MTGGAIDVSGEAAGQAARLRSKLEGRLPAGLLELAIDVATAPEPYTWVPEGIARANAVLGVKSADFMPTYNRYVLLRLIARFSPGDSRYRLPASILSLYPRQLMRIYRQAANLEDGFFDISNDSYLKDLAILTHRLIPVGAEFAEGGGGIPRRLLLAGGPAQFLDTLRLVLLRCRGLKPFFALHAHTLALDDFNPQGWLDTYRRLAHLLALNPQVKGWLSASWFLDPALESVSPHLAYLRRIPVEGGATLLFVRNHRDGSSGALSKSAARRRLFAEGKYVPATYMRVWPRQSLIEWARRQENAISVR